MYEIRNALVAVSFGVLAAHARADVWDVAADYSINNGNPNGAWSYGWMDHGFTTFTPYVDHFVNGTALEWGGWGLDHTPCIWQNVAGSPNFGILPGHIAMHPGNGFEPSVARWTAPAGVSGMAWVNGAFTPGDVGVLQVAVRHNGVQAWHSVDSGSFLLNMTIAPGDTIDFAVYAGYVYGNTGLDAYISVDTACPADMDDGTRTGTPDGGVTIEDLLFYLQLFADGDIRGDVDDGSQAGIHDGGVTIDDLLYFLVRFAQGC